MFIVWEKNVALKRFKFHQFWTLLLQICNNLFVLTMKNNSKGAMVEPHPSNPFISVWRQLTTSQFVVQRMLEYIKLSKLQIVQVLDFVKDEYCFSTLSLWKANSGIGWQYIWTLSFKCLLKILKLLKFSLWSNYWRVEGCP